jgi:hypothetical protein
MPQVRWFGLPALPALAVLVLGTPAVGDNVVMKNGTTYRGAVDRDNTIVWVFDGLKRIVVRDSKVARIDPEDSLRNLEAFRLVQPLVVHGGVMPKEVLRVEAEPWNDKGRRIFTSLGSRSSKPIRMEQAINELGPYLVKLRGVDGFWLSQLSTRQVPREVVLGLLAKVERTNQNERLRVARFLIQAEWYAEAKAELDVLAHDFPALRENLGNARASVCQLEAARLKDEIDVRRRAQQFRDVMVRLRTFPTRDVSSDVLVAVRDQLRHEAAQASADKALAASLRGLAEGVPGGSRMAWRKPLVEVVQALAEAPDAVRDRFVASQKAQLEPGTTDEARFALAMSGFVVGSDAAVPNLETAALYWKARDLVRDYLAGHDEAARGDALRRLDALKLPDEPARPVTTRRLDLVTRLAQRMPPPWHDDSATQGEIRVHRVVDAAEDSADYTVLLPPEYHPLRSYPAVVALHDGRGPHAAIDWCKEEGARRGYLVIAPEYNQSGGPRDYFYTEKEHAAVELALRDARRRYAIDSDRVFAGGPLVGGNMAWDFGLAHPDRFAGVFAISGLPGKYVFRYLPHVEKLPLYVVEGDLAPASNEVVFGEVLKPLILKAFDATYVEYWRRGLEDFPEEAPAVFDWMDRRRREPCPKAFDVATARVSDDRFYGVVVRDFQPGRATAPEVAEPCGKNLNPATIKMKSSSLSNLINIQTNGIRRLDVWVSPKLVDFQRKIEVRINGKPYFKELPKPSLEPLLEDLRLRGDRHQVYWLKVSAG